MKRKYPRCLPVFAMQSNGDFSYHGTSFLVKDHNDYFQVTAAHVVDDSPKYADVVTFGTDCKLKPLPLDWLSSPIPESGTREDDPIDLSIVELSKKEIDRYISIGVDLLDITNGVYFGDINKTHLLAFCGYPGDDQAIHKFDTFDVAHMKPWAFLSKVVSQAEISELGYSADLNIVVEYNNAKKDFPFPPGMSGGPVFLIEDEEIIGLVGITHKWCKPGYLVATRAHVLWGMFDVFRDNKGNANKTLE